MVSAIADAVADVDVVDHVCYCHYYWDVPAIAVRLVPQGASCVGQTRRRRVHRAARATSRAGLLCVGRIEAFCALAWLDRGAF